MQVSIFNYVDIIFLTKHLHVVVIKVQAIKLGLGKTAHKSPRLTGWLINAYLRKPQEAKM